MARTNEELNFAFLFIKSATVDSNTGLWSGGIRDVLCDSDHFIAAGIHVSVFSVGPPQPLLPGVLQQILFSSVCKDPALSTPAPA